MQVPTLSKALALSPPRYIIDGSHESVMNLKRLLLREPQYVQWLLAQAVDEIGRCTCCIADDRKLNDQGAELALRRCHVGV